MIKIYIKNKLRIFKNIKDYFKDLKKRPCCKLYLILTFFPQQVPPPPGGCFNGSINYRSFTSIDFTSIGGEIVSLDSDTALIDYLATLGIIVTIQGCVITIISGSTKNIVLPLIK